MTPHRVHIRPLDLMITRIRRGLVQDIRRRPAQLHPLAPETNVPQPRDVLIPIAKVVREEQAQPPYSAELGPLDGQLLHLGRAREFKRLCPLRFRRDAEVDIVPVDDDLKGFGC